MRPIAVDLCDVDVPDRPGSRPPPGGEAFSELILSAVRVAQGTGGTAEQPASPEGELGELAGETSLTLGALIASVARQAGPAPHVVGAMVDAVRGALAGGVGPRAERGETGGGSAPAAAGTDSGEATTPGSDGMVEAPGGAADAPVLPGEAASTERHPAPDPGSSGAEVDTAPEPGPPGDLLDAPSLPGEVRSGSRGALGANGPSSPGALVDAGPVELMADAPASAVPAADGEAPDVTPPPVVPPASPDADAPDGPLPLRPAAADPANVDAPDAPPPAAATGAPQTGDAPATVVRAHDVDPSRLARRIAEVLEGQHRSGPPRSLTVEVGEIRLAVTLRGDAVRVAVLGGELPGPAWDRDLAAALRSHGFDLADGRSQERSSGRGDADPWAPSRPHATTPTRRVQRQVDGVLRL